MTGYYSARNES